MANPGFTKGYIADTDIGPYLIVKFGAVDGSVALAGSSTDNLLGISVGVQVAAGQTADVIHDRSANCTAGGTITFGDWLTSDSLGRAVKAAPSTGTNAQIIGKALSSALLGDVFPVLVNISQIQG